MQSLRLFLAGYWALKMLFHSKAVFGDSPRSQFLPCVYYISAGLKTKSASVGILYDSEYVYLSAMRFCI